MTHQTLEPGWHALPSGAAWFVKGGKLRYYDDSGSWVCDAEVPSLEGLLEIFEWTLANKPAPVAVDA